MHPEADAFLDAIFGNPDDDTPRLVYADWLTEHGQESYAQFIRLQCAAARHPLWSAEANRLWEEIGRVWPRLEDEWWPATRDGWEDPVTTGVLDAVHFERGFLRPNVVVTAGQLAHCAHCWAWLPTPATKLDVAPGCGDLNALATSPVLRRIRHMRCYGVWASRIPADVPAPHDGLDDLLASPHLCSVRTLNLSMHRLTSTDLEVLVTAPNLATVAELKVLFDSRDWNVVTAGCIPDQHPGVRKLLQRFPFAQCDIE